MTLATSLNPIDSQRHLFVVRLWCESLPPASPIWRGSVEHIPSGQRLYFSSLIDLTDFIGLRLGGESIQTYISTGLTQLAE